jgi:hypothetical protein
MTDVLHVFSMKQPSVEIEWVAVLLHNLDVPVTNLCLESDYPAGDYM